jgi:Icc-related predicted phosphoesterase
MNEQPIGWRIKGLQVLRVEKDGGEVQSHRLSVLQEQMHLPHRGASLDLLAFSDYRVQDIERLVKFIKKQKRRPHLILYAGDDVDRFRPPNRNLFEEMAGCSQYGLCAVAGNDDHPAVRDYIIGERVYPVHSQALVLGAFAVVGVEGAPLFPAGFGSNMNLGPLLYPEPVLRRHLRKCAVFANKKLIIVSHAPPFGVLDLAARFGVRHIGSRPLRDFLESSKNIILCVGGHVHRCGGQQERFGTCTVVNVASHDRPGDPGRVAHIELRRGKVAAVNWHQLK